LTPPLIIALFLWTRYSRTVVRGRQPRETAEQVPVLAVAKRFIETAGPKELRVPDQHHAAIDNEITGEQIVQ
jgi:hypothetical protein